MLSNDNTNFKLEQMHEFWIISSPNLISISIYHTWTIYDTYRNDQEVTKVQI